MHRVWPCRPARTLVTAAAILLAPCTIAQESVFPAPEPFEAIEPAIVPIGQGKASWYGPRFHGRRTSSGERFDMNALTAAHPTLAFGTKVRVLNEANGREVVVRINDRGPHIRDRIIDLSKAAAAAIDMVQAGEGQVLLLQP